MLTVMTSDLKHSGGHMEECLPMSSIGRKQIGTIIETGMGSSTHELSRARQHGECWHLKLGLLFYRNPNSDKVLTDPQLLEILGASGLLCSITTQYPNIQTPL